MVLIPLTFPGVFTLYLSLLVNTVKVDGYKSLDNTQISILILKVYRSWKRICLFVWFISLSKENSEGLVNQ